MTALDPAAFLRGNPFPPREDVPYPRVDAVDQYRLPGLTWLAGDVPAGVRLELDGDARGVAVEYTTRTDQLGPRGPGGGTFFEAWVGEERLDVVRARLGAGRAELRLQPRPPGPVTVHLPEGMRPVLHALHALDGELVPAPRGPRWTAYGDSILEGWVASSPALAWPARVARARCLDLVNLGYAGAARGEVASAETVAGLPSDLVTLSYGTNCWSMIPHSDGLLRAGLDAFLTIVRQDRPTVPVLVVSPILRPAAEDVPNRLGATLASLRAVVEDVVAGHVAAGDRQLTLLPGSGLVPAEHLPDGIHPDDEGHRMLAEAVLATLPSGLVRAEI